MAAVKRIAGLLFLAAFAASCATHPPVKEEAKREVREVVKKEDDRDVLQRRVEEYWRHQIKPDVEKAYQFELPEYREKVSILEYANRLKMIKYVEAKVAKIEVDGDRAKVKVDYTYRMLLQHIANKHLNRTDEGDWIKIKGIWYHIPEGFKI